MGKYKCRFCSREMIATPLTYQSNQYCNHCFNERADSTQKQNLNTFEFMGEIVNLQKNKIKYDYDCKHYFGIISAESEEEARKILNKDHTGNGDKLCNWSKTTKKDCQTNCKLKLKKK